MYTAKQKSKLVRLPKTNNPIVDWLQGLIGNIPVLNPTEILRTYRPLDRGNRKLYPNILSFSLLSITTCGQYCLGCYDLRAMRYASCRLKRLLNTSLAFHDMDRLESLILKQIRNSKTVEFIRIHVGGEFYSLAYATMWKNIALIMQKENPELIFYTYTKSMYTGILKAGKINVVKSIYSDNGKPVFNYAPKDEIVKRAKEHNGYICPATRYPKRGIQCGSDCRFCMNHEHVFFIQH